MKGKIQTILASLFVLSNNALSSHTADAQNMRNVYQCIEYEGNPTTVVDTQRGRIKLIVWQSDYFNNSGWTPQKRCEAVTARFQKFSDDNNLKYVSTGIINKYKVICVASTRVGKGYNCNNDGLLITLEAKDNPQQVLNNLFVNASKIGGTAVLRGKTTISIETILDRANVIEENQDPILESETRPPSSPTTVD